MPDDIEIFRRILFYDADLLDTLDIKDGTAVENGELGTIHLYEAIVDTHGIEGC